MTLTLTREDTEACRKLKDQGNETELIKKLPDLLVAKDVYQATWQHFGFGGEPDPDRRQFRRYIKNWTENKDEKKPEALLGWDEHILQQICGTLDTDSAELSNAPFWSFGYRRNYRLIIPEWVAKPDGSREFKVLFYPWAHGDEGE